MENKNDYAQVYADFLSESKHAGILPPSRVSETMLDLAQINASLLAEKTRASIECEKMRGEIMCKVDEATAKPMTGTKADSIVNASEAGQRLEKVKEGLAAIDGYHWALRAHHESMNTEWARDSQ